MEVFDVKSTDIVHLVNVSTPTWVCNDAAPPPEQSDPQRLGTESHPQVEVFEVPTDVDLVPAVPPLQLVVSDDQVVAALQDVSEGQHAADGVDVSADMLLLLPSGAVNLELNFDRPGRTAEELDVESPLSFSSASSNQRPMEATSRIDARGLPA